MVDIPKLEPYWWEVAPRLELPVEPIPNEIDVAIVGPGFAGLSAALTLVRAGRSVAVFEQDRAGEGASTRNGGIASGNIKMGFSQMIEAFGLDRAKQSMPKAKRLVRICNHSSAAKQSIVVTISSAGSPAR